MLTITDAAARQIETAAQQSGVENPVLRIAAKRMPDGGIDHTMGFDQATDKDTALTIAGVGVAISPDSKVLVQGLTLDYVELKPGEFHFIFSNPNDPQPPASSAPA